MNITTIAWFQSGITNIPNIVIDLARKTVLNSAIATYEPKFLRELLGYEFYKGLQAYVDSVAPVTPNPLYDDILKGVEYRDSNGILQKYDGIKRASSLYIFFNLLSETATTWNGIGEYAPIAEGGKFESSNFRMSKCWNLMRDRNISLYEFIGTKQVEYAIIVAYVPTSKEAQNLITFLPYGL